MASYTIEWSIPGSTVIEADSPAEATAKFWELSNQDLASDTDDRETFGEPKSAEDLEEARRRRHASSMEKLMFGASGN